LIMWSELKTTDKDRGFIILICLPFMNIFSSCRILLIPCR
jgi:hypothetical protein